ncbi:MAG: hypothetical protein FJW20_10470 [Acidimicrobiia bacterium]|nr:hypothetical protein [Acidimicrobiia bacterium]
MKLRARLESLRLRPQETQGPRAEPLAGKGHGFGTAPVLLAAISTILGAVMFLRFGYAVGHLGLGGSILLIILGHAS